MQVKAFIEQIRTQIADGETEKALLQLRPFLQHSPKLNEALLQSARWRDLVQQIRLGTVSFQEANLTKNQINYGLLDLLSELEQQSTAPELQSEMQAAVLKIENSSQVIANNNIQAGRDVIIDNANTTNIQTESKTSQNLRLFLFLLVPLLAIAGAYFWYQNQVAKQPLNMKVLLENNTPNQELPEPNGTLILHYGGEADRKSNIQGEAIFENIPSNFKTASFRLQYDAAGFVPIDTTFIYTKAVNLSLRRNDDFALMQGYIYDADSDPLEGIEGVEVSITCCKTQTDASGKFSLSIPFEYQRKKQRLDLFKVGYEQKSTTEPVITGELIEIPLEKK